jgi:hypothetical protein
VAPEEKGGYSFRTSLVKDGASQGVYVNVLKLQSMNLAKRQRMITFISHAQNGTVFISTGCEPVLAEALRSQFRDFPGCIDDECDALDAGAYVCDPVIAESYAPVFNFKARQSPWAKKQDSAPQRCRYAVT